MPSLIAQTTTLVPSATDPAEAANRAGIGATVFLVTSLIIVVGALVLYLRYRPRSNQRSDPRPDQRSD